MFVRKPGDDNKVRQRLVNFGMNKQEYSQMIRLQQAKQDRARLVARRGNVSLINQNGLNTMSFGNIDLILNNKRAFANSTQLETRTMDRRLKVTRSLVGTG